METVYALFNGELFSSDVYVEDGKYTSTPWESEGMTDSDFDKSEFYPDDDYNNLVESEEQALILGLPI